MTDKEQKLLLHHLQKHFSTEQIEQMIQKFTLSQLRKFTGEIDIEYFALSYFNEYFSIPFGKFHNELFTEMKYLIKNNGVISAFAIPRSHGKSTILNFLLAMYSALYKKSQFTVIISATEAVAQPFLEMIKSSLLKNEAIIEDFGNLKGQRWNNSEIWLEGGKDNLDACISIKGISGSIRGVHYKQHRPSMILIDDLLKDSEINSELLRDEIKSKFKNIILSLGDKDTNILVVGTILSENDLMADLMNNKIPGVRIMRKSAIEKFSTRDDLWNQWEKLYTCLDDENRLNTARQYYLANEEEMINDTKVLWSEYYSYYDLMEKKLRMSDSSFYREMQNDPRNAEEYPFLNIQYWDKLPDYDDLDLIMVVDPSLGKTKKSDFTAMVIIGKSKKTGQIYVLDGDIERLHPHLIIDKVISKIDIFPVNTLGVEAVAFQSLLLDDMKRELLNQKKYHIKLVPINTRTNKEGRIMGLENSVVNGYIKFNPDNVAANKQFSDYSKKAKYDDFPDAVAMAVSMLSANVPKKLVFLERHKWGL